MFEAQLLISKSSNYDVYSPWFPRGGDNITATVDVIEVEGATITIRVFTKAAEDNGPGVDADNTKTLARSTTGRDDETWPGDCKDLVRYKFTISGGGEAGKWILFRMLPPIWFDDVEA